MPPEQKLFEDLGKWLVHTFLATWWQLFLMLFQPRNLPYVLLIIIMLWLCRKIERPGRRTSRWRSRRR